MDLVVSTIFAIVKYRLHAVVYSIHVNYAMMKSIKDLNQKSVRLNVWRSQMLKISDV